MVVERSNVRKWNKMKPTLAVLVSHFASNQSHSPLTLIGKGRVYGILRGSLTSRKGMNDGHAASEKESGFREAIP